MNHTKEYWEARLKGDEHPKVQAAIKRIYDCYPDNCLPQGVCDPMYIMNVIAFELGIGDGHGNFNLPQ